MSRRIEVGQRITRKNDEIAAEFRERFQRAGVKVSSLVSAPGSGKTAWLARTLSELKSRGRRAAALVGDLESDCDARRLAESGLPVQQIETHGICHLEAYMLEDCLRAWNLNEMDHLFLENVGNLVCPLGFDLGESLRVLMISTPEGEDKPLKYPQAVAWADLILVTKMDLAAAVDFDEQALRDNIQRAKPNVPILFCSARSGQGMDEWLKLV
ncbi:MAG: hydrogenase nickel incorporation protein HypB [Vulcanimicrobiota bacterium]